ncbi:MAG: nickel-dependent lactate racemase family protein [Promethearchaeota archaeon]|jgi:nickel-dependent lactate racemase
MKFNYGKKGLDVCLDSRWNIAIIRPNVQQSIADPVTAIREAINNPTESKSLYEIMNNKSNLNKICIVVSDATRPVPSHIILDALIKELNDLGIQDDKIVVLIATGLHRPSRENELKRILGDQLRNRLKVINHVATEKSSLRYLGDSEDKIPIYINKHYLDASVKIITGYVEPHFFFGFAGGRKSIVPGIAGVETIQANHSAKNIASQYSRFGLSQENPMHKSSLNMCKLAGVDFSINVCINEKHEIVKVAAGNFEKVHHELVEFQLKNVFTKITEPYDIVVCGNGGYPLDLNLYQAVKSMAIGEIAVKERGTIISVNECVDGIGHEKFKDLIFSGLKPEEIYNKILAREIEVPDQWEIQILTRILMKTEVIVVSELKENEIGNIGLKYADNIEEAIKMALKKHGSNAKILILPNGPQILPILKKKNV